MTNVTKLDPLTLPFAGSSLIEASAGTGKTYTISGLYLRLLLGDRDKAPLTCEQILVVTFTNAATEELRDRIRKRIQVAFKCFLGLETDDAFVNALYQQMPVDEHSMALRRLDLALKSLDEAAIFTIHGFCQRILSDMAFESSLLFESEFTLDDSEFLHHAVRDFWREACYPLPPVLAQVIANEFGSPDELAKQLRQLLGATQANTSLVTKDFNKLTAELSQSLSRFKMRWKADSEAELELLHSLPLNGARFGKKADDYPKLAAMFDKLTHWASAEHASLPPIKELEMLALSGLKLNKGGEIPTPSEAPLLDHIERLFDLINQIKPAFLVKAKEGIKLRFAMQKAQRNLMTPDDLLMTLAGALHSVATNETNSEANSENDAESDDVGMASNTQTAQQLAKAISTRFPVALIDEFQDTDPLQFAIFSAIYQQQTQLEKLSLLMIGDPKQAIYAFRGADIHTYISARKQTQSHYNLETNYRSSTALVNGVNQLFSQHDDPFISDAIPYDVVNTPKSADTKVLTEANNDRSALRIKLLSENESGLNKTTARKQLAGDAASEIKRLLTESQAGQCHHNGKALVAKDIAVLVRDRNEAAVMKQALSQRNIGAVFLSRDSVFKTQEAFELAIILRALATPKDERCLRAAMATELMGFNALQIHQFNQDEEQRQTLLDTFAQWHQLWSRHGIMPALLSLANETQLIRRFLSQSHSHSHSKTDNKIESENDISQLHESGERRLTDFRHLSELLQQKATELDGSSALINWFEQQLIEAQGSDEQQLRLESEQNLVQIVTIHKSKGLEYPVCFVPFISLARDNRRKPTPMLYHQDDQLIWDVEGTKEGWEQYKQENLAEDLRLLYVALTRPVYVCYLYIANHSRMLKAGISSQLFETAIGYLLGITSKDCDFEQLEQQAQKLLHLESDDELYRCAISITEINQIDESVFVDSQTSLEALAANTLNRGYDTPWRVGSYSGLVKHLAHEKVSPGADDEDFSQELQVAFEPSNDINPFDTEAEVNAINRFTFERGANAGSFMHLVMELFDFTQADIELAPALEKAMEQYGFDKETWTNTLTEWYQQILHTPLLTGFIDNDQQLLNSDGNIISLSELTPKQTLVEMEFYLPITRLKAQGLNTILSQFGYDAGFEFDELQGMLKGFIDLTFEYQGRFYIADYKSNHLGEDFSDYDTHAMAKAISSHRYNLQYILYTLALHRYLALRLPQYDYNTHIGGCFYLFLRGMTPHEPQTGVFFDKPPQALIDALDRLFQQGDDAYLESLK